MYFVMTSDCFVCHYSFCVHANVVGYKTVVCDFLLLTLFVLSLCTVLLDTCRLLSETEVL